MHIPLIFSVFDFSWQTVKPVSLAVSIVCELDPFSTWRMGLRKMPSLTFPRFSLSFQVNSQFSFLTKNLTPKLDPYPMDDLHIPGSFMIGSGWSGNEILHMLVLFIFGQFFAFL